MGLELYLDLLSQPCRAVFIFAKKNGIPFQLRTVQLLKGQNCSKEFLQINSLQKVPVLKDGDFILTESPLSPLPIPVSSSAILIYLSCKYQVADHWYPSDLQTRSQIHEYLGWHADNIRSIFGVTLWIRVLAPLIGIQVPEEKVKRNRTYMDHALQRLESKFLGDKPFLVGQQVSMADLMLLEELIQPVALGYDVFVGRPRLAAWRGHIEAFLDTELWQEAHGPIFNILEQMTKKTLPVPPPESQKNMLFRISKIP
ncbi:glutathione S-transferase theta-2B isoform X1 [Callospermophilus lateralis]|uniref:glutathione S-transferase theta-2B isoform X1 n=1 Tax=Callospermophilus lateralis TaxID=76772 RepID=UPI004038E2D0